MKEILAPTQTTCNSKSSHSSDDNKLTTITESIQKKLTLHSSDLAFLRVVHHFCMKGKNLKCHLTRAQWPVYLLKFGGKALGYEALKKKWRKMAKLGCIVSRRRNRRQNSEYEHLITDIGISVVDNFKNNCAQVRKRPPKKSKKVPLEMAKSTPPLTNLCEFKNYVLFEAVDKCISEFEKVDPEYKEAYQRLRDYNIYPAYILNMFLSYSLEQMREVNSMVKQKNPKNKGAYFSSVLIKIYGPLKTNDI